MPSATFRRAVAVATTAAATCALAFVPITAAGAAVIDPPVTDTSESATLELTPIGTYETGIFDASAAEIVHSYGDRLFVVNAQAGTVEALDAANPSAPTKMFDISSAGVANSLAVREDGLGVIAFEDEDKTAPGRLVFFDADFVPDGDASPILGEVTVGALPDMVTISEDGTYAVVANEGEPADDFSVDPEGSIGIVTLPAEKAAPAQDAVRTAGFGAFEGENLPADVRVFGPDVAAPDQGETALEANRVSRNLEPEYVAIADGTAYAALQEANAVAVVDLASATVTDIWPLGFKDYSVETLDASDRDPEDAPTYNQASYEGLYGVYMPDGIEAYEVGGQTYLVTANEGDSREWGEFIDAVRAKDLGDVDETDAPAVCETSPLAGMLEDEDLGRLNVLTDMGLNDEGTCFDELYTLGGRSFSIWTTDGELVFDSGSDFEEVTAAAAPEFFNSNHTESNLEGRSEDKGPEPENLAIGTVGDRTYAFIGLERVGGVMTYDITDPANATYMSYLNNRDFSVSVEDAIDDYDPENADHRATLSSAGDLGPEGLEFIPASQSPIGEPLLAVGNEVSGTTTVYAMGNPNVTEIDILTINDFHGRLEAGTSGEAGAGVLAGIVEDFEARNPNTLFVSAGDNIGASTFTSFSQQDNPTIDALLEAGLDVGAVGNHEFDRGFADLSDRVIPRFGGNTDDTVTEEEIAAGLPYNLGANVYDSETGLPVLPEYAIKTVDGVDIGFIGTVTPDTATMVDPAGIEGIEFGDELEAANRVAAQIADETDVLILLTHSGAATSDCEALAADQAGFGSLATGASADIDAIVSAHTHQTYACDVAVEGTDGDTRPVIQAFEYGKAMGLLNIDWDTQAEELISIQASTFLTAGLAEPDAEVQAIVDAAVAEADEVGSVPVGEISADILRGGTPSGADRGVESSMGNWVADVYLWATSNPSYAGTPAEIALMNPGGLRADLAYAPDGVITYKEAAEVQPFANTLVTMTLTGAQIEEILEDQWKAEGDRPKLHLGVSEGFTYEYTESDPRSGDITEMFYEGEPIAADDTFTVVTNSFVANGGDGFPTFTEGTDRTDTGQVDLTATVAYFEAFDVVDPAPLGRAMVAGSENPGGETPGGENPGTGNPAPEPTDPGGELPGTGEQTGGDWAEVTLSNDGRVEQGGTLTVTLTGLEAGQQVAATLFSDPIKVTGIPAASTDGSIRFSVEIPADFELGAHRMVITTDGEDPIEIGVDVVEEGALAATGAELPWGIALGGAFLLVAGGVAFAIRRRQTA